MHNTLVRQSELLLPRARMTFFSTKNVLPTAQGPCVPTISSMPSPQCLALSARSNPLFLSCAYRCRAAGLAAAIRDTTSRQAKSFLDIALAVMIRSTVQKFVRIPWCFAKTSDLASNLTLLLFEHLLVQNNGARNEQVKAEGIESPATSMNTLYTVCSRTDEVNTSEPLSK